MKAAPPIESLKILPDKILEVKFEGMPLRYVDLKKFPLLGIAKQLLTDDTLLSNFEIVDGIPEWAGRCLLGPEDMLKHSTPKAPEVPEEPVLPVAGKYTDRIKKHYS